MPVENLIGGVEGEGLKQGNAVFGHTRLMVGAFGLGGGRGAIERALQYAQRARAVRRAADREGGLRPQAPRAARRRPRRRPRLPRRDRDATRRRRDGPRGRGRHRQAVGDRGGEPRGRRRGPGARRLRLHAGVHRREDPARRAHHEHLRGHERDPAVASSACTAGRPTSGAAARFYGDMAAGAGPGARRASRRRRRPRRRRGPQPRERHRPRPPAQDAPAPDRALRVGRHGDARRGGGRVLPPGREARGPTATARPRARSS